MAALSDMAASDVNLAAKSEKAAWYREVLELEPGSKVFLPFARLLAELGRAEESVRVLRQGLGSHPEFIEARLFLIDLLHKSGDATACGAEVARLAALFREYPGFWDAWRSLAADPASGGSKPDLSVSLGFLGAVFRDANLTLVDVLAAGLDSLQGRAPSAPSRASAVTPPFSVPSSTSLESQSFGEPSALAAPQTDMAERADTVTPPVFAPAPPHAASVPASDVADEPASGVPFGDTPEDAEGGTPFAAPSFVFGGTPVELADHNAVPLEEKCSLRTRSMAEVLAEQGDVRGAVDIYEDLLACAAPADVPALQQRLDALKARIGEEAELPLVHQASASSQPRSVPLMPQSGVLDLLEKLATRLETKARR